MIAFLVWFFVICVALFLVCFFVESMLHSVRYSRLGGRPGRSPNQTADDLNRTRIVWWDERKPTKNVP